MSDAIAWRPLFPSMPATLVVAVCAHAVARIDSDRCGHVVTINLHRRHSKRMTVILPTRALAVKMAERWTRANLRRLDAELSRVFAKNRRPISERHQ